MKLTKVKRRVRGRWQWCIDYRVPGQKRTRRYFKSEAAATAELQCLQMRHDAPGSLWFTLSAFQRHDIVAVFEEVTKAGFTIRQVWEHFKGTAGGEPKLMQTVVSEMIITKKAAQRRQRYLTVLRRAIEAYTDTHRGVMIGQITAPDIEQWLNQHNWTPRTRMSVVSRFNTLFSFALRRGYVKENPCVRLEKITLDQRPPIILSISQCARAVSFTRRKLPKLLPWLALGLFAGVRPEEADQITWQDLDLDRGTCRIDGAVSKVRTRRIVHLKPAAVEWLRLAKAHGGELPIAQSTRRKLQKLLRARLGFKQWPPDVLRHTAASYWLALDQDAGKVANELGNSAAILLRHYRELVYREAAEKFWGILPTARMLQGSTAEKRFKIVG